MRGGEREGERDREGREGGGLKGEGGKRETDRRKKEREGGREGTGRVRVTESERGREIK